MRQYAENLKEKIIQNKGPIGIIILGSAIFVSAYTATYYPFMNKGVSNVESFCDDHSDICGLYNQDSSLASRITDPDNGLYVPPIAMVVFGIIGFFCTLAYIQFSAVCKDRCIQQSSPEQSQLIELSADDTSRCRFFKTLKNKLAPDKFAKIQLGILGVSLAFFYVANVFGAAQDVYNTICGPNGCAQYFPNATDSQIHEVADLAHDTRDWILGVGIPVALLLTVGISLIAMMGAAYRKYQAQESAENRNAAVSLNYSGGDEL